MQADLEGAAATRTDATLPLASGTKPICRFAQSPLVTLDETGGCVSMHGSSAATKFSMSPAVLEMYLRNDIPRYRCDTER